MQRKTRLKIFVRSNNCPKCYEVLRCYKVLREKGVEFEVYDIDTLDGLTEASSYGVVSIPTILEVNEQGEKINSFLKLEDFLERVEEILKP